MEPERFALLASSAIADACVRSSSLRGSVQTVSAYDLAARVRDLCRRHRLPPRDYMHSASALTVLMTKRLVPRSDEQRAPSGGATQSLFTPLLVFCPERPAAARALRRLRRWERLRRLVPRVALAAVLWRALQHCKYAPGGRGYAAAAAEFAAAARKRPREGAQED